MCWVFMWITLRTCGDPVSAAVIASTFSGDADSPTSSPFISMARVMAMTTRRTPMAIEPRASQRGSSVKWARSTPARAMNRPISAPMSSSSTTGSSGDFSVRMNRHHDLLGVLVGLGLAVGGAQRERLEADGEHEDADRHAEVLDLVRVAQLGEALVEGEHAAEREQHEGDDERPEVALPAVAEGVLGVRLARRPLAAEHQQALVAGVGERVERLGEQAGRAGDEEPDELGDGDPEVGEERGEDRLACCLQS